MERGGIQYPAVTIAIAKRKGTNAVVVADNMFSMLVAFVVTPWAAVRILKRAHGCKHDRQEDIFTRFYRRLMGYLLHRARVRWSFLAGVVVLLLGAVSLFYFKALKVKMLPFDNKSEFQVIVDMPNGTTLEQTQHAAELLAREAAKEPEVVNLQPYAGTASPYSFNGLVRHYYLQQGSNIADIQVNLVSKSDRKAAKSRDRQECPKLASTDRRSRGRKNQGCGGPAGASRIGDPGG